MKIHFHVMRQEEFVKRQLEECCLMGVVVRRPESTKKLTLALSRISGEPVLQHCAYVLRLRSCGSIQVRSMVSERSPAGLVFIPFHFVEAAANLLTLDRVDKRAKIPDFKVCAVRMRKTAAPEGRDPDTDKPLTQRGAIKDQAKLIH